MVNIERAKSKKQTQVNLEIFRLREKDVPVDVVELKPTDSTVSAFWEPKGDRFALITSEAPQAQKMTVQFYEMNSPQQAAAAAAAAAAKAASTKASGPAKTKRAGGGAAALAGGSSTKASISTASEAAAAAAEAGGVKLTKSLDRKGVNQVLWSPLGRVAVLAGIKGYQGELEFWDTEELIQLGSGEHYMCTDAEWDPSGRYLTTSISSWRVSTDPGFTVWTCAGVQVSKNVVPQFKQILWRPRPPTPLSADECMRIRKGLKEYSKVYDEMDAKQTTQVNQAVFDKRVNLWNEWVEYRRRCESDWKKEAPIRLEIVGFDIEEDAKQGIREVEQYVDEIVDEVEEVVPDDEDED